MVGYEEEELISVQWEWMNQNLTWFLLFKPSIIVSIYVRAHIF